VDRLAVVHRHARGLAPARLGQPEQALECRAREGRIDPPAALAHDPEDPAHGALIFAPRCDSGKRRSRAAGAASAPRRERSAQRNARDVGDVQHQRLQEHLEAEDSDMHAHTIASAIEIGRPVNLPKALRALETMDGVVREADDDTILEHKAMVGRFGFGCEPASAASVAGAHQLVDEGVIGRDERVVCILTGHVLKDPDATVKYHTGIDVKSVQDQAPRATPKGKLAMRPVQVPDDLEAIIEAIATK
jgi:hypothetical protein